ncbi:efflux RND transporter permease subunit, partial [bacterium]|nr:efflux RND transporter permease subunit [bacterium]
AGIFCYTEMRKEAFPPVDQNKVVITTPFYGASAEKVERLVTTPLERELKVIDDIDEMTSNSVEGQSTIMLKIEEKAGDVDKVVSDIQKAVDRVVDLPEDVTERPIVTEIKMKNIPVVQVSINFEGDIFELRDLADILKERLEDISGVASVNRAGWDDEQYWVEPNLEKMQDMHIPFSELAAALKAQNVDLPGGKQEYDSLERVIKIKAEFRAIEDIQNTIIRANDLGNWIRVKDIANVKRALRDSTVISKSEGKKSITLTVVKQEKGDIIKVVDSVKKVVDDFKTQYGSSVDLSVYNDLSFYVKRRLNVLKSNGVFGFILVTLILFVFLPPISATMTAMGIPIAFFITFCIMKMFGLTVNLLTMFGLVMVLGMIVDDGIIISENVFRYIEKGFDPHKAAVMGTDEVAAPVLSTVLTTIVAFSPLMFMTGLIGKFVKYIPFVVIIALGASLIEAYFILPSHLADFARRRHKGQEQEKPKWFYKMRDKYVELLKKVLKNRYRVSVGVVIFLFSILFLGFKFLPFELFGGQGVEEFGIGFEAKPDTNIYAMDKLMKPFEDYISSVSKDYIDTYDVTIGKAEDLKGSDLTRGKTGSNYAKIIIFLTPAQKRDKTIEEIIAMMRKEIVKIGEGLKDEGLEKLDFDIPKSGPPVGSPIDIGLRGNDFESLLAAVKEVENKLKEVPGVLDVDNSYKFGSTELNIIIDEEKAQQVYLTNSDIAYAIRASFAGVVSTTIKREKAEKEIEVLVRLPENDRNNPDVLNKIFIKNQFDRLIPLDKVVKVIQKRSIRSIQHYDGKKIISVTANIDKSVTTSLKANNELMKKIRGIEDSYHGVQLVTRGEQKETKESFLSLFKAFLVALFLIYVILATQFNSLVQPLIIMAA